MLGRGMTQTRPWRLPVWGRGPRSAHSHLSAGRGCRDAGWGGPSSRPPGLSVWGHSGSARLLVADPSPRPWPSMTRGSLRSPPPAVSGQFNKERPAPDQWEAAPGPSPIGQGPTRRKPGSGSRTAHGAPAAPQRPGGRSAVATGRDGGGRGRGRAGRRGAVGTMGGSGPGERRRTRTCLSSAGAGRVGGRVGVQGRPAGGRETETRDERRAGGGDKGARARGRAGARLTWGRQLALVPQACAHGGRRGGRARGRGADEPRPRPGCGVTGPSAPPPAPPARPPANRRPPRPRATRRGRRGRGPGRPHRPAPAAWADALPSRRPGAGAPDTRTAPGPLDRGRCSPPSSLPRAPGPPTPSLPNPRPPTQTPALTPPLSWDPRPHLTSDHPWCGPPVKPAPRGSGLIHAPPPRSTGRLCAAEVRACSPPHLIRMDARGFGLRSPTPALSAESLMPGARPAPAPLLQLLAAVPGFASAHTRAAGRPSSRILGKG